MQGSRDMRMGKGVLLFKVHGLEGGPDNKGLL